MWCTVILDYLSPLTTHTHTSSWRAEFILYSVSHLRLLSPMSLCISAMFSYIFKYIRLLNAMKMGKIVPRAGIEPTPPPFWVNMLTITAYKLPWCHYYAQAYLSMQLLASDVSTSYHTCCPGIVNLLMVTITYRQWPYMHIHTQGSFNNHTVHRLYRIMVMATSAWGLS